MTISPSFNTVSRRTSSDGSTKNFSSGTVAPAVRAGDRSRSRRARPASGPGRTGGRSWTCRRRGSRCTCSRRSWRSTRRRPSCGSCSSPAGSTSSAALAEIAADGAEVADLRRGDRVGGLGQAGELGADVGVLFELRDRRHRADLQAAGAVRLDVVEAVDRLEVDDAVRADDVRLQASSAGPARRRSRAAPRRGRPSRSAGLSSFTASSTVEALAHSNEFMGYPRLLLCCIRPLRILSGVIGSSRTRTPQAL